MRPVSIWAWSLSFRTIHFQSSHLRCSFHSFQVCLSNKVWHNSTFVTANQCRSIQFIYCGEQFAVGKIASVALSRSPHSICIFFLSNEYQMKNRDEDDFTFITTNYSGKCLYSERSETSLNSAICFCRRWKNGIDVSSPHSPHIYHIQIKWHTSVEHGACSVSIPMHLCLYLSWCVMCVCACALIWHILEWHKKRQQHQQTAECTALCIVALSSHRV